MQKGNYTGRPVNFTSYVASCFTPHLFAGPLANGIGCGASALALLTGVLPALIASRNGSRHYSDKFMLGHLHERGFTVLPLTQCNVTASTSEIGNQHVVLLSQLFRRNEATWGVIFNERYFHNFETYALDALSMLNKPVLSAYLVFHPRWRFGFQANSQTTPKLQDRTGGLKVTNLYACKRNTSGRSSGANEIQRSEHGSSSQSSSQSY